MTLCFLSTVDKLYSYLFMSLLVSVPDPHICMVKQAYYCISEMYEWNILQKLNITTDWIIYMDSDTVAMASLRGLWDLRHHMNPSQVFGATFNDLGPDSYSKKPGRHVPFVPPWGKNKIRC